MWRTVLGRSSIAAAAVAAMHASALAAVPDQAVPSIRFIKNIPYDAGSDLELGQFTVTVLGEDGRPVCLRDEDGRCRTDDAGNVLYETEQRDYAFAGTQRTRIRIVDVTHPDTAFVAATINCNVDQGDIQVRVDLGLLVVAADSGASCGLGGSAGLLIFDVSDPRTPMQRSVFRHARGAHNSTFHPSEPLLYISDSDFAHQGLGEIPIVDVSQPANPTLVQTFRFHAHSAHDITFDASGDRAYSAAITHTDIIDTSDPRNPTLTATIHDPSVMIHHQADPTPDGRYLILAGETVAPSQCPGGWLHFYDLTIETAPAKIGAFFVDDFSQQSRCFGPVFRMNDDGKTLTAGWGPLGTRVVDVSSPVGAGAFELAAMIPSGLGDNPDAATSWTSKMYKGHIYSSDRNRGLDIMAWESS